MSYLHEQMERLKWDKRMRRYNLKNGVINSNTLQGHLEGLPDTHDNATPIAFKEDERRERANGSPSSSAAGDSSYNPPNP